MKGERDTLDEVADDYVRLVLAVQRHSSHYVDAYFGPPAWRAQARRGKPRPVTELIGRARELLDRVRSHPGSERQDFLECLTVAVESYARILSGEHLSWRQTVRSLFDTEPLPFQPDDVARVLKRLDDILPGRGSVSGRIGRFLSAVRIPRTRLRIVVVEAEQVLRTRTRSLFSLPSGESVRFRLVRGKPWSAYTWYRGGGRSIIDIDLDHRHNPQGLLEALAHETYPGHHTFLSIREQFLVREAGWREHSISTLMSPLSLISEGAAYVALQVILEDGEIRDFVRNVLAPKAGVSGADFERYFAVNAALGTGEYQTGLGMEAARRIYEDGATTRQVVDFMIDCGMSQQLARSAVRFAKTYNVYFCTYRLGLHVVKAYLGTGPDRVARYGELLRRPFTPSALLAGRAPSPKN